MNRRVNIFRRGSRPPASARLADVTENLEHARGLDRTIRVLSTAVRRTLRPGPVKDTLHGVPFGHPAHPPLTDVPIGMWVSAAVLDLMPGTRRASQALVAARPRRAPSRPSSPASPTGPPCTANSSASA
ncbi:hypothetical protein LUX33_30810 [Actinomadura madurae]|uniref:hypothetical protein n=1 Tax=Actinomadura madurae TaxID=1993 RepID=UPI0020D22FBA|nr:hypothetical protein [Actinomadura madurae]MCP9952395.1 hypothetical protein [Actinomadura madurae]